MTRGLTLSVLFHAALIAVAVLGLPHLARERTVVDRLVVVDVVTVAEVTNAPPPSEEAKPVDAPPEPVATSKPEAARTPPPPPAAVAPPLPPILAPAAQLTEAVPVPQPKPEPAPSPAVEPTPAPAEVVEAVPVPEPKPEPAPAIEPEPAPVPEPALAVAAEAPPPEPEPKPTPVKAEPEPTAPIPTARPAPPPRRKPEPKQVAAREAPVVPETPKKPDKKDAFLNVLKTVQKLKDDAPKRAEPTDTPSLKTEDSTARRASFDPNQSLSVSEMDAIRRQVSGCWLVPAGAKDAGSLVVEIDVVMNPDRTVRSATVIDRARMSTDPFFRAAAESALRALRSPTCTPLKLPPEKYETWNRFTITFDPKDMLS
ncbi:MAG: hypothetical protein HQ481_20495 [Alphaproteobacteria bacterium]|nr:hypothetical protein [Alphaproteobacteria bacterium]